MSFRITLSGLQWNIQWHKASRGLSATAELLAATVFLKFVKPRLSVFSRQLINQLVSSTANFAYGQLSSFHLLYCIYLLYVSFYSFVSATLRGEIKLCVYASLQGAATWWMFTRNVSLVINIIKNKCDRKIFRLPLKTIGLYCTR